MATLRSVNLGHVLPNPWDTTPVTGIDKRPVSGPVAIADPGWDEPGGEGLAGDHICDKRNHGGPDAAVYAYAREDLDGWQRELQRTLHDGVFGENLTTEGIDISNARIGERWLIGSSCVLQVCSPRIPCRTFAGWLQEQGWQKRFTERGVPGAYLRVIEPGSVQAGDSITVVHRPPHHITIAFLFRALTTDKHLLPQVSVAGDALDRHTQRKVFAQ